jgi:hypothetical protein
MPPLIDSMTGKNAYPTDQGPPEEIRDGQNIYPTSFQPVLGFDTTDAFIFGGAA